MKVSRKLPPGRVRDAIVDVLRNESAPKSVSEIERGVSLLLGATPKSSVRSYLALNTPDLFARESRGVYGLSKVPLANAGLQLELRGAGNTRSHQFARSVLYLDDCFAWLGGRDANSIQAVVTDPPYGLHEYSIEQQTKLRNGKGGVWRIPPSFDGHLRSPLPRFTTLTNQQLEDLYRFFLQLGRALLSPLVPGAHVIVASNPLVSYIVSNALADSGLERRGEIMRLVMTLRGGDRPKAAHEEYAEVSVMPRSMWEPWLVYRKPIEGRVQDNLKKWATGGFRRPSKEKPFGDVIRSSPTRSAERELAPHPSLKPQAFLRQIVRAVLPLGTGVVLDPFAGSGSTLAAAEAVGYSAIGVESDERYFEMACSAVPKLARLQIHAHD